MRKKGTHALESLPADSKSKETTVIAPRGPFLPFQPAPKWFRHSLTRHPLFSAASLRRLPQIKTRWPARPFEPLFDNNESEEWDVERDGGEGSRAAGDEPFTAHPFPAKEDASATNTTMHQKIEEYLVSRPTKSKPINSILYLQIAEYALKCRLLSVVQCLVDDIVDGRVSRDVKQRTTTICKLLSLMADSRDVTELQVLRLLRGVPDLKRAICGRTPALARAGVALAHCDEKEDITDLLSEFVPLMVTQLREIPLEGPWSKTLTWSAVCLIRRCLTTNEEQHAFALFESLVSSGRIPNALVSGRDSQQHSDSFKATILSILVRACEYWYWNRTSVSLLGSLLQIVDVASPPVMQSALDTVARYLKGSWKDTTETCAPVICMLAAKSVHLPLSNAFLQLFFETARTQKAGASAETVYSFLRWHDVARLHEYLPPEGPAAKWFLEYILLESKTMWLARDVLKRLIYHDVFIPEHDRADLVTLAAGCGFSRYSRALWERFTARESGRGVAGNAACALRLVSLFSHLERLWIEEKTPFEAKPEEPARADDMNAMADEGESETVPRLIRHDPASILDSPDFDRLATRHQWSLPERRAAWLGASGSVGWRDFHGFALQVIQTFRNTLGPLAQADHTALNALARLYFIVGDTDAGIQVFAALLARREIPDIHDINVILTPLARESPRRAAKMLVRMVANKARPDAVTVAMVLHETIRHGDLPLVHYLFGLAQQLGIIESKWRFDVFTPESMCVVIRTMLVPQQALQLFPGSKRRDNLRRTLRLARLAAERQLVAPQLLGFAGTHAALRDQQVALAFEFWRSLVRDHADWEGREHRRLREKLAGRIRAELGARVPRLFGEAGRLMLRELEQSRAERPEGRA